MLQQRRVDSNRPHTLILFLQQLDVETSADPDRTVTRVGDVVVRIITDSAGRRQTEASHFNM